MCVIYNLSATYELNDGSYKYPTANIFLKREGIQTSIIDKNHIRFAAFGFIRPISYALKQLRILCCVSFMCVSLSLCVSLCPHVCFFFCQFLFLFLECKKKINKKNVKKNKCDMRTDGMIKRPQTKGIVLT